MLTALQTAGSALQIVQTHSKLRRQTQWQGTLLQPVAQSWAKHYHTSEMQNHKLALSKNAFSVSFTLGMAGVGKFSLDFNA